MQIKINTTVKMFCSRVQTILRRRKQEKPTPEIVSLVPPSPLPMWYIVFTNPTPHSLLPSTSSWNLFACPAYQRTSKCILPYFPGNIRPILSNVFTNSTRSRLILLREKAAASRICVAEAMPSSMSMRSGSTLSLSRPPPIVTVLPPSATTSTPLAYY